MLTEFGLIDRYFARRKSRPPENGFATLGIGDDCALLAPGADVEIAVSTDMLLSGRHFFADVEPNALGHKALAVNLSDLAAMGAKPRAFTLALALPEATEAWLEPFAAGMLALADRHGCELIGGDTTRGPLTICITVFGELPRGTAIRRDGARAGDDVWISGNLGDARLALGALRGDWPDLALATPLPAPLRQALERPQPRLAAGLALRGIAHAMLDISDGLAGDLAHILESSNLYATIDADAVPRSTWVLNQPLAIQRQCTLAGGDDYELCFTAAIDARAAIEALAAQLGLRMTRVGRITASPDGAITAASTRIDWRDAHGSRLTHAFKGFDHFHAD